jgi:hypothetical protein
MLFGKPSQVFKEIPLTAFPVLPLAGYRLRFIAEQPLRLPAYAGSAWRGAFGHTLKRLVCVTREPRCADCLLHHSCSYPYLFETPPDPAVGKLRKYPAAPHPFLLLPPVDAPNHLQAGDHTALQVTLFGHGVRYLPYVLHALAQAAAGGIGKDRGRLALDAVWQAAGDAWEMIYRPGEELRPQAAIISTPPACPNRVTVRLLTPLRLAVDDDHITPATFVFHHWFGSLLRRISLLTAFHTDTPLETEFAALNHAARAVPLASARLRWWDWTRYSSRQQRAIAMGGLVGEFELGGEDFAPFWPYLWLGQWTHGSIAWRPIRLCRAGRCRGTRWKCRERRASLY